MAFLDPIVEASPLPIFTITPAAIVTSWNAAAELLFGWHRSEVLGRPLPIVPAEKRDECAAMRARAVEIGGAIEQDVVRVKRDGTAIATRVALSPLRGAHGELTGFIAIVQDLTAQIAAESALRESEERYRAVSETTSDYACSMRVAEDGSLACEWVTGAFTQITGHRLDEWESFGGLLGLVHPEDRSSGRDRLTLLLGGQPDTRDLRIVAKDGCVRWIHALGKPVIDATGRVERLLMAAQDITERKLAEEAHRRSEANFRALIESAPVGILVHDGRAIRFVNKAIVDCLGYGTAEELVGRTPLDLVHPEDRELAAARLPFSAADPAREERLLRKDGSVATVEATELKVTFDEHAAVMVLFRDVTERKQLQVQLLLADRMASMGTLAAGVAHEINNPLSYVLANVSLGDESLAEIERTCAGCRASVADVRELLRDARDGLERMRIIVGGLKAFSRADDDRSGPVDVHAVLESSISVAWNEIRHRARLVRDYGDVPHVRANEARLGQVFLNLLTNAAQAIAEGGVDDNEIRLTTRVDDAGYVRAEVRDTGAGIRPEIIGRIFDPFFTTKAVGAGTGLGLAISHGIVAALGGELTVESDVGRGALFRLRLPMARGTLTPAPTLLEPEVGSARRTRVLIIDDDGLVARAVARTLSDGHIVTIFTSAREALAHVASDVGRYDIILCDLMMPELNGMELYEELERVAPTCVERIVFLTGGAFTPRAGAFLGRVPNLRIEKPFDTHALRALVSRFAR